MSRTNIDSQSRLRTDDDTPDLNERSKKKVRWNSDSVLEGDKEGESEESSYDAKVGFFCLYTSTPLVTRHPRGINSPADLFSRNVFGVRQKYAYMHSCLVSRVLLKRADWMRILQPRGFLNLRA